MNVPDINVGLRRIFFTFKSFSAARGSYPSGGRYLQSVWRVILSSSQSSKMSISRLFITPCVKWGLATAIFKGASKFLPLAQTTAIPDLVLSTINSLSNSARPAKLPKTSLPTVLVMSVVETCPERTFSPVSLLFRLFPDA